MLTSGGGVRTRGVGVRTRGGIIQTHGGHISDDQRCHTDDASLPSIDEGVIQ